MGVHATILNDSFLMFIHSHRLSKFLFHLNYIPVHFSNQSSQGNLRFFLNEITKSTPTP